jgi:hypothetical protein
MYEFPKVKSWYTPAREPQFGPNVQTLDRRNGSETGDLDMIKEIYFYFFRHLFLLHGQRTLDFGRQLSVYIPTHLVRLVNSSVLAIKRAGHLHIKWIAVSSSCPHAKQSGLSEEPILSRCFLNLP